MKPYDFTRLSKAREAQFTRRVKALVQWAEDNDISREELCARATEGVSHPATRGGARDRSGALARNWLTLTGNCVSLHEMPIRIIVERELAKSRQGVTISEQQAFARVLDCYSGSVDEGQHSELFKAYQHAILRPSKAITLAQQDRRAIRRKARALTA